MTNLQIDKKLKEILFQCDISIGEKRLLYKDIKSLIAQVAEEQRKEYQADIGKIFDNNYDPEFKTYDTDGISDELLKYWQKLR